jgi:hypothetical protein
LIARGKDPATTQNLERHIDATGRCTPASRATPARSMRSEGAVDMRPTYSDVEYSACVT